MLQEVVIFNRVNSRPEFSYTGADICRMSGIEKSQVSRFLNGKIDISMGRFFRLIRSMPREFQEAYWKEILKISSVKVSGGGVPWTELISNANFTDIDEILSALSNRWSELKDSAGLTSLNVDREQQSLKELASVG